MATEKQTVAILGGGSFGTILAHSIVSQGHTTRLWMRDSDLAHTINTTHCNTRYLPEQPLSPALFVSTDLAAVAQEADIVFMAVPSTACRAVARQVSPLLAEGTLLISTIKGIEATPFTLMSEVLREEIPQARLGVLSGPNLAKEIAAKQITATVIASSDEQLKQKVQSLLQCRRFRVYSSVDMEGVELGGALKNVYAIISGMAAAQKVGLNTLSLLMTRSLAEMSRFAAHRGANPMTFLGLAGVGDLIATCLSPLSRNYQVGFQLGQGKDLARIKAELGQVAEGIHTLKLLKQQATEAGIYMPLVAALYDVVYHGKTIAEVVNAMMAASQPQDVEFAIASTEGLVASTGSASGLKKQSVP